MVADPSYAAYVDVRWPMLYRLAALLVGEEQADEIAQEALVRAYLVWPRRVEDDPPDEKAKAILVQVSLERAAVPRERAEARSRLAVLPPRQRVIVVLRWFEYLSDADVARLLGSRREAVEAEGRQALAASGISEAEVAAVLARAADEVVLPLPPGQALLARCHEARRRRTRRSLGLVAVGTVVVVLALGAGTALQGHASRHTRPTASLPIPRMLSDLRAGDGPRTPYAELTVLHLAGTTVQLEADPLAIVPAAGWTFVSYSNGTIVRVDDHGEYVSLVTTAAAGPPVVDRAGRYVAWVEARPGLPLVVVQPTDVRHDGARRRARPFPASGEPVALVGITRSGDVVGSLPAESLTWEWHAFAGTSRRGDPFRDVEGLGNGVAHQLTPGELVVQYPPNHVAVGRLDGGGFVATEDLVATTADFADPRGRRIVYVDGAGEVHVRRRAPGFGRDQSHDLRLQLPRLRGGTSGIAWEDDDHVLLEVADDSMPMGALVRCDVRSGGCEIAVRFEEAPHRLAR